MSLKRLTPSKNKIHPPPTKRQKPERRRRQSVESRWAISGPPSAYELRFNYTRILRDLRKCRREFRSSGTSSYVTPKSASNISRESKATTFRGLEKYFGNSRAFVISSSRHKQINRWLGVMSLTLKLFHKHWKHSRISTASRLFFYQIDNYRANNVQDTGQCWSCR
jgi:hypothetical protein